MVVPTLGMVAGPLAIPVCGFRSGELPAVVAGSFGTPVSPLLTALWAKSLVDDFS